MKLRIRGNSIRLRLGESEVARLGKGECIAESIQFSAHPESHLSYSVALSSNQKELSAKFSGNEITVSVPDEMGREWANSQRVGLKHEQCIGGEVRLLIVIEKDFRCLEPRPDADETDAFPNPAQGAACGTP
jgi:hypothetical protein